MRKLSAKWVPKCLNADQKHQRCQSTEQLLEFFRHDPNDFLSSAFSDHGRNLVISLWTGDKETINGVAAKRLPPKKKNSSSKNRLKISRLGFLGSRRHPPHWLSSKGPNYKRGVLLISASAIEGHFEGKRRGSGWSPRGSCSFTAMTRLTGHLQPRRNWSTRASSVSITHPFLRIWPRRTTTCSLDWKYNWKVANFRPTQSSMLPWRPGWTDNLLIFFEWFAEVRATG